MMTWRCKPCDTNWPPYQCQAFGGCPDCGSGVTPSHDPASPDANHRYLAAVKRAEAKNERLKRESAFRAFCADRDVAAFTAWLDTLPTAQVLNG